MVSRNSTIVPEPVYIKSVYYKSRLWWCRCAALAPAVCGCSPVGSCVVVKSKRILNHHHGEADNGLSLRGSHVSVVDYEAL